MRMESAPSFVICLLTSVGLAGERETGDTCGVRTRRAAVSTPASPPRPAGPAGPHVAPVALRLLGALELVGQGARLGRQQLGAGVIARLHGLPVFDLQPYVSLA